MNDFDPEDLDLFPEPVSYPAGPLINGTVVNLEPGYPREVRVGQPLLAGVLAGAGVARVIGGFLIALLPGGVKPGSVWRNWRSLRKGPEYLVTPLRLRDRRGVLAEVEIHGYLSRTALERGDLIRGRIKAQRDRELPPRVERLDNLTTGQILRPSPPTLWSHLGPALLLQAIVGAAALVLAIAAIVILVR
jgi:hypothetical protein